MERVKSPVDTEMLQYLLEESNYDRREIEFLVDGFKNGFSIGYQGKRDIKLRSPNLKLDKIGTETDLWNKVMKEVKEKRYAGPFKDIPFDHYIQSPIGLVPKDNGASTRLIFHLSYPRLPNNTSTEQKSVNANTPQELCKVKYPEFDKAIQMCLKAGKNCFAAKSDLKSAFRHFGIKPDDWMLLVMKARNPLDGEYYFFVDKCMPFGAAISCSHFQRFSNALAHIVRFKTENDTVNYLDDFFFAALLKLLCNKQVKIFTNICDLIKFPWSMEKTHWATTRIIFLGLLIDTRLQKIFVPLEKVQKALNQINTILGRKSKKATLKEIQSLCGTLNFFGRCIIPSRTFTRRLYAMTESAAQKLKPHHHLKIKKENRLDLRMWEIFLQNPNAFSRDFCDFSVTWTAKDLDFYTDASRAHNKGCGGYCDNQWFAQKWSKNFIKNYKPSIAYLELYAVTVGVALWINMRKFWNKKVAIFCDNQSVVNMINNSTSSCKHCMVLLRYFVLEGMKYNVKITAKYVNTKDNDISDSLSRLQMNRFRKLTRGRKFSETSEEIPEHLWPVEKLWHI